MAMQVELVSPERILYSGEADMVIARTLGGGEIAFLTGHAPFLGALGIGKVEIVATGGGARVLAAVHGGFVEVKDDRVIILSDVAELADQIDAGRAQQALTAAEDGLRSEPDSIELADAVLRAELRLLVAGTRVG